MQEGHRAHRLGELHVGAGDAGAGQLHDQQVQRGAAGGALLWRQREHRPHGEPVQGARAAGVPPRPVSLGCERAAVLGQVRLLQSPTRWLQGLLQCWLHASRPQMLALAVNTCQQCQCPEAQRQAALTPSFAVQQPSQLRGLHGAAAAQRPHHGAGPAQRRAPDARLLHRRRQEDLRHLHLLPVAALQARPGGAQLQMLMHACSCIVCPATSCA